MTTTPDSIAAILDRAGIVHTVVDEDLIVSPWRMERYRNSAGQAHTLVAIHVQEGGEYVAVRVPTAFRLDGPHQLAARVALDQLLLHWKVVDARFDPDDGEVLVLADLILEDAALTDRQLVRTLGAVLSFLDHAWCVVQASLLHGQVEPGWIEAALSGDPLRYQELTGTTHPYLDEDGDDDRLDDDDTVEETLDQLLAAVTATVEDAVRDEAPTIETPTVEAASDPVRPRRRPGRNRAASAAAVPIEEADARTRNEGKAARLTMMSDLARRNRN